MGMPKEADLELKVGAFVMAAIVCLVVFIFSISDFSVFKRGATYRVMFQYANGLKKGSPVRLAGVDTGHIRQIKTGYDAAARASNVAVDIWVEEGQVIPADSTFLINQLGILGEKYLEIMPGVSPSVLAQGAVMRGEDPVPMEVIIKTLGSLGAKIETALDGLNGGILTEANKASLAAALANVAAVTGKLRNGEGTVGKFLTDPSVFNNIDELSADLKANPWKLLFRPKGK
jgi:phospholipid/cholesterol/gamma-HCH transport system substrate-binding protein